MADHTTVFERAGLDFITEFVEGAIKQRIEKLYKEKQKELLDHLEYEKSQIIAGVLLETMRMVDIESAKDRIIFTVRTAPKNEKEN